MHTGSSCGRGSGEGGGVARVKSLLWKRHSGRKHAGVHGAIRAPDSHQGARGGGEGSSTRPILSSLSLLARFHTTFWEQDIRYKFSFLLLLHGCFGNPERTDNTLYFLSVHKGSVALHPQKILRYDAECRPDAQSVLASGSNQNTLWEKRTSPSKLNNRLDSDAISCSAGKRVCVSRAL